MMDGEAADRRASFGGGGDGYNVRRHNFRQEDEDIERLFIRANVDSEGAR